MQRKRFRGRKFLIIKYKVGKGASNQNIRKGDSSRSFLIKEDLGEVSMEDNLMRRYFDSS